jgi:hypothetical protein
MKSMLEFSNCFARRIAVGALLFVFLWSWRESDAIHSMPTSERTSQLAELASQQSAMFEKIEGALPFLGRRLSSRIGSGLDADASVATIQREVVLSNQYLLGATTLAVILLLFPPRLPKSQSEFS